jgi:plastocyanin
MRFRAFPAILVLAAAACGGQGGEQSADQTQQQATPGAAGPVVEVQMTGTPDKPVFAPLTLTVASGTTVKFINAAAGPHNVMFPADSVPAGAATVLTAAMKNTMGPLNGPMLTQPNEAYEVSFAGAPAGRYVVHCLPHMALGMRMVITVQ